jgi:hypothetical protein
MAQDSRLKTQDYFFFFGIRNMIMRLPSSLGMLSTMADVLQVLGELQQQDLAALLEHDGAAL